MIVGAANPVDRSLQLETYEELRADHFLNRRELGIINISGNGYITVDEESLNWKNRIVFISEKENKKLFSAALIKQILQNLFYSPALLIMNSPHD